MAGSERAAMYTSAVAGRRRATALVFTQSAVISRADARSSSCADVKGARAEGRVVDVGKKARTPRFHGFTISARSICLLIPINSLSTTGLFFVRPCAITNSCRWKTH
jgi:hypothetical protein